MMPTVPITRTAEYPRSPYVLIGLCALGCIFSVLAGLAPLVVWGGLAALGVLFWCFMSPVGGLCVVLMLSSLIIRGTEGITIQEAVYASLFVTVILGWGARRLVIGLPLTITWTDRMFVWFLMICLASVVPAVLYGNALLRWFRELIPFLMFAPYLIIITTVRRTREIRWFCLAFIFVSLMIGINNLIEYRNSAVKAEYLWELMAGRRALNESLFFVSLTILLILVAFEGFRGWRTVGYLSLIVFFLVALAVTFTRGYWVATLIALMVAIVQMPSGRRRTAIRYLAGLALAGTVLVTLLVGPLVVEVASAVAERFGSISSAMLDLSIKHRLAESMAAFHLIMRNPIVGYGLGFLYSFYPLIPADLPTWYVHNVYLFLWLKLGIFGLTTFLVFYLSVVIHGYRAYRRTEDPFLKPLTLGITSVMVAMIPLSITSPQFIQKDSILFLSIGMGIVEFVYRGSGSDRMLEA